MAFARHRQGDTPPRSRLWSGLLIGVVFTMVSLVMPDAAQAQSRPSESRSLASAVARVKTTDCSIPPVPATSAPLGDTGTVGIVHEQQARVILIGVCINNQGPFVFVLDTGAPYSLIGRALSERLGLESDGKRVRAAVLGCSTSTDQPVGVANWSAGGLALNAQSLVSARLGSFAPGLSLSGILGSDVLARFGAVRVDYQNQTLSVPGPASASPVADASMVGPAAAPSPFDLLDVPRLDVGIDVLSSAGRVEAIAAVRIRGRYYPFIVDTGAVVLAVGPLVAMAANLKAIATEPLSATNCNSTVPLYRGGKGWRLGNLSLRKELILGAPADGFGAIGLLGSTVLSRFGDLVVDYANGRLLLGS